MKLTKITTATLLAGALGLALSPSLAGAADPPAKDAAAQPAEKREAIQQTAFLGVETVPLRVQARRGLDLVPGTGLAIRDVRPGTPAHEAGLLPGDVLVRLNDQLIVNGQQLAVLVRTFAPGDAVALHVLRDGEPVELRATIAGRVITQQPAPLQMMPGQPMPRLGDLDALFDQLRGPRFDPFGPGADMRDMFDQMQRRMFEQRDEMQRMMDQMRDRIGQHGMQSSVSVNDGEHAITLRSNGQDRYLVVETRDGELLFDGPVPEDGQIDGLPADVQQKVNDLIKNNRIEFRMPNPAPQPREPLPIA